MAELWEMMMEMWAVWAKGRCWVVWWIDGAEQETGVDFSIVCLKSSLLLLLGVPRTLVRGYYA